MYEVKISLDDALALLDKCIRTETSRSLLESLTKAITNRSLEKTSKPKQRPLWEFVVPGVKSVVDSYVNQRVGNTAFVDQSNSALFDSFKGYGADLRNEQQLFAVLVTANVFLGMAEFARNVNHIDQETFNVISGMVKGIVVSCSQFIPDDVK